MIKPLNILLILVVAAFPLLADCGACATDGAKKSYAYRVHSINPEKISQTLNLTSGQLGRFNDLFKDFEAKINAIHDDFHKNVSRMLNDDQRKKFDSMRRKNHKYHDNDSDDDDDDHGHDNHSHGDDD